MDLCQKGFSLLRGLREESKNDGWGRLVSHQVRRVMSPMFAGGNSFTDDWSADSLHWLTNEIALETFPSSAISSCKIWLQTHPASDSVLGDKQLIMIVIENFFFWRRLDLIGWWHVKERKKKKSPLVVHQARSQFHSSSPRLWLYVSRTDSAYDFLVFQLIICVLFERYSKACHIQSRQSCKLFVLYYHCDANWMWDQYCDLRREGQTYVFTCHHIVPSQLNHSQHVRLKQVSPDPWTDTESWTTKKWKMPFSYPFVMIIFAHPGNG